MLVTPDKTIKIGDQAFTLVGSFGVLKQLQHVFARDIIPLQGSVMHMRQDQIAKVISIAASVNEDAVGQLILDEMDVADNEYIILKTEIMTWLFVAMTPRREREKKSAEMSVILDSVKKSLSSPGTTTSESPPESSDGPSPTSGEATSGPSKPQ